MLCSYGFILQLRRSPTPCCAGNGTLVTRVHRVQLACERQAAQSWRIRASSLPFDFWCKLGLFDLCCLEKQSAALREGACLSERAGCRMVRSRQAGSTGEGRPDGQSHQGLGSQSRHHALLCREGSDGFGGSWITPNCLGLVGFLVGAHHPWSQLGRHCCGITLGQQGQSGASRPGFPPRQVFTELWICCHRLLMIGLTPLSENKFSTPHLVDSIHRL